MSAVIFGPVRNCHTVGMSITTEWISRIPRTAFPARAEEAGHERSAARPTTALAVLAGAAWLAQAVILGFLAYYLLGDAATGLVTVIAAGSATTLQIALSVVALVIPFAAAAGIGVLVRRDGAGFSLTVAAMIATVLCAGLLERGLTALMVLFAGS